MISIIGAGRVGSTIAFLCGSYGLDDVILVNRNEKKAIGEALDISNAIPADSTISISGTSNYSKIQNSDVVVITANSGIHKDKRSENMLDQSVLVKKITNEIAQYASDAKILVITNPVDVLTYLVQKEGKFDPKNVLGVASSLDSARFRYLLAKEFSTNQSDVKDALVMGEHDDSMVPIFSHAKLGKIPIIERLNEQQKSTITLDVRNYWKYLRDHKGSSVFGIAKNTFDIIQCMIKNQTMSVPASVLLDGQYDLNDVCIGVPLIINKNGVKNIRDIVLTSSENQLLCKSADAVKNNITTVNKFLNTML